MRAPIYLDHHATTPCDPAVVASMLPYFTDQFGNAGSSTHRYGLAAAAAVERARRQVAASIGADPAGLIFTSGATEADNLAVLGVAGARGAGRIVTTAIEHAAVLDAARHAADLGFGLTIVPVGVDGVVDPAAVAAALGPDVVLVSVMLANNEIGTVQPIRAIADAAHAVGVPVHVDAVQGPGQLPVDVDALGADLLALSAHKLYGPKGIGALWVRPGSRVPALSPLLYGGGQERGLRAGTLPVPLIVGFGEAAERAAAAVDDGTAARIAARRDALWEGLAAIPGAHRNGCTDRRLPANLSVRFDGIRAATLIADLRDTVALSAGSACASGSGRPSHVLGAIGLDRTQAASTLRFGVGRGTTEDDVAITVAAVTAAVARQRGG
jgi:cysteine desulfurase